MNQRHTKRVNGRFTQKPTVGDLVVNADRQTERVPRFRVMKVNGSSAHLAGIDTNLNIVVRFTDKARHVFKIL